ncbi:MAG: NUDIX domain-containing protein [Caldimonas sp.]
MNAAPGAGGGWLAQARAAADTPPQRPRAPLLLDIEGHPVRVGSVEPETAELMRAAGLPLRPSMVAAGPMVGNGWQIAPPADASLARIATWLHAAGLAGAWRDELLAVVDGDERDVARVERAAVRPLGLTTYAVHLVGRAFDGEGVWVQQRALDKATDPGQWDTLMGGQVAAGETADRALARETWEEAGLDVATLIDLRRHDRITIRRPVAEGYMVEHIDVFSARLPPGCVPSNRDGEVERFECLDRAALASRLAAGVFTLEASLILAASGTD